MRWNGKGCYTYSMSRLIVLVLLVSFHAPCFAWDNSCYKGSLASIPFPRENRSLVTLEAGRVVSVEGNLMTYDLGGERVVIKMEGVVCLAFLKEVQKGRCTAKSLVSLEVERKNFSDAGRYKATAPSPH
jgi:hypothetical protein